MVKRILSIAIVLVLTVGLLPMLAVFAKENSSEGQGQVSEESWPGDDPSGDSCPSLLLDKLRTELWFGPYTRGSALQTIVTALYTGDSSLLTGEDNPFDLYLPGPGPYTEDSIHTLKALASTRVIPPRP